MTRIGANIVTFDEHGMYSLPRTLHDEQDTVRLQPGGKRV